MHASDCCSFPRDPPWQMFQTQRETSRALHSLKEATDGDCPHWKAFLFMGRMFESRFEWSNAADSYAKAVRGRRAYCAA